MRKIIVGSRRSKLAITQTNWVIKQLKKSGAPFEFEVKEIVTKGDKILDITLSKVGGKGLFVKEIEQALLNGEIDMAVHSMKDMPSQLPEGLIIGCTPVREDHRDVLISKDHLRLDELPEGAVIGTSSLRRSSQLLAYRPDLEIKWIRGNIDTRIEKLKNEEYDAIILAAAGLARMGWSREIVTEFLDTEICLPAVGQGALAIECRQNDEELLDALKMINHDETKLAVDAERTFLNQMNGSCQVPIAGYAAVNGRTVTLSALIASPDGKVIYKDTQQGENPLQLGKTISEGLEKKGAKALIEQVRNELDES
ncbi:hydroxymethylbilane synthase [Metabacillus sp. RGM 3146]|uniref:hydroxymethylbilane synthase n=1 Tax=Metabacillus sp. RGM 3146 TaxID=3401092 RepID=UPI003B99A1F1